MLQKYNPSPYKELLPFFLITLFVISFSVFYLKVTQTWWFEDDPLDILSSINHNPIDFFINTEVIKNIGTGNPLVPFKHLSQYIDVQLAGLYPSFHYWHTIITTILAAFGLYSVLNLFSKNSIASFFIVILWILLPSTITIIHFIAARHYMEGMPFACLAIYCTYQFCNSDQNNSKLLLIIIISSLISMLYKEIYITSLPTFIFLYSIYKKKYKITIIITGIAIFYAIYRLFIIGLASQYGGNTPLKLEEYFYFFQILPNTFTTNPNGVSIYLISLLIIIYSLLKDRKNILQVAFFIIMLATAFIAIYIIMRPIMQTANNPGTWTRGVFMLNTVLLFFTASIAIKIFNKYILSFIFIAIVMLTISGTHKSKIAWDELKLNAKKEGIFYLENPDKLLISTSAASWFIRGVHHLYNIEKAHYIWEGYLKNPDLYNTDAVNYIWEGRSDSPEEKKILTQYNSIWKYHQGEILQSFEYHSK